MDDERFKSNNGNWCKINNECMMYMINSKRHHAANFYSLMLYDPSPFKKRNSQIKTYHPDGKSDI